MPPLHRQIQLRRLESRHLEVGAKPRAAECGQPLAQSPPRTREHRHLLGKDRSVTRGGLLAHLIQQVLSLVTDAEKQERDQGGGERPRHDQRPQVDLDQTEQRVVDRKQSRPRIP